MLKKLLLGLMLSVAVLVAYALVTAPAPVNYIPAPPTVGDDPQNWLAQREAQVHALTPLVPGTEKRVRWFNGEPGSKTPYAVIYLHGFSATRRESAPVAEQVAHALGANLFETRLRGHGLVSDPLTDVATEAWLDDGVEALAVGAIIGQRSIVIGLSTGATLALALARMPLFETVDTLVLVSPNFAPRDDSSRFLTAPGGPLLARMMIGPEHRWEPANEAQGLYWATHYPLAAIVQMMRLVEYANSLLPITLEQRVLGIYSPNDTVINPQRVVDSFALIDARRKHLQSMPGSGDPSNHILAGDIMSPQTNAQVIQMITSFVSEDEG